ncbi:hypothetical protein L1049_000992 [Liquidambar formosana]|uniref:Uncharacterized protein n=1 Tax=Liquidambar formosana TaxID=63359 RepID=A0AAP0N9S8_LIQFO
MARPYLRKELVTVLVGKTVLHENHRQKPTHCKEEMEISSDHAKTTQQGTSQKGGLRTMPFIIANESFEKVASVGLHANMILYLISQYHFDSATGASILFLWAAISNFMPILGAFLADSYLGRFRVIGLGTVITLLGIILLWLTAIIQQARPHHCDNPYTGNCASPKPAQLAFLFSAFSLMSIGAGGIRACSLAFGADQFDKPDNPKNDRILQTFFNWYYASVGISVILSVTIIVYIQTKAGWVVGFGVPVGLMFLSTVLFFFGSSLYVKVNADKSLFSGFAKVITVAFKNKHLALPPKNSKEWYHHKGSKLVAPTGKLRFLNKACMIRSREKDLNPDGSAVEPKTICTVRQVEELKALIRVLPIWSTGIIIAVTISQHSFPILQAATMDRRLTSNFTIPPGSFAVFAVLTLTIWVAIYDPLIIPFASKFTKRQQGLSLKQRMGIGLVISCLATAVSAVVERHRRAKAIHEGLSNLPKEAVHMSAMWLVPQHCLTGLAEAFNAIGQIQFYYSQFPKTMSSIGVALFALGMAVGNLVGSLIVQIVDVVSKRGGKESWVSSNLNKGHYDYYYWVLTILSVVNVFYYLLCSWAYGDSEDKKVWDEGEILEEIEMSQPMESPMIFSI